MRQPYPVGMKYGKDKNDGYTVRTISPGSWGHNDPKSRITLTILGLNEDSYSKHREREGKTDVSSCIQVT